MCYPLKMKAASLDIKKLTALCNTIRTLGIPLKERNALIEQFLKVAGIIRECDTSDLICAKCAQSLHNYKNISTLYRRVYSGELPIYSLCHKDFVSRKDVEALPPLMERSAAKKGNVKVRVGMTGK